MILVKFDDNWADEMDVSGFKLFDNLDAWNAAIAEFKEEREIDEDVVENNYFEINFGTNEWNVYESLDDFLSNFEVIEISDTDAAVIEAMFPEAVKFGYGHFPI